MQGLLSQDLLFGSGMFGGGNKLAKDIMEYANDGTKVPPIIGQTNLSTYSYPKYNNIYRHIADLGNGLSLDFVQITVNTYAVGIYDKTKAVVVSNSGISDDEMSVATWFYDPINNKVYGIRYNGHRGANTMYISSYNINPATYEITKNVILVYQPSKDLNVDVSIFGSIYINQSKDVVAMFSSESEAGNYSVVCLKLSDVLTGKATILSTTDLKSIHTVFSGSTFAYTNAAIIGCFEDSMYLISIKGLYPILVKLDFTSSGVVSYAISSIGYVSEEVDLSNGMNSISQSNNAKFIRRESDGKLYFYFITTTEIVKVIVNEVISTTTNEQVFKKAINLTAVKSTVDVRPLTYNLILYATTKYDLQGFGITDSIVFYTSYSLLICDKNLLNVKEVLFQYLPETIGAVCDGVYNSLTALPPYCTYNKDYLLVIYSIPSVAYSTQMYSRYTFKLARKY